MLSYGVFVNLNLPNLESYTTAYKSSLQTDLKKKNKKEDGEEH